MSTNDRSPENLVVWTPAYPNTRRREYQLPPGISDGNPRLCFVRNARVLHSEWGLGKVLHATEVDQFLTVEFPTGVHRVPRRTLRLVLPVTVLARIIQNAAPQITSWAVRKANEEGAIQPDSSGRFAGHRIYYYDAARIPALIDQLSERDQWASGTLVLHPHYGPGRIVACEPQVSTGATQLGVRLVSFFNSSTAITVSVQELRRLVPSHAIAKCVGANRRTFRLLAARYGVYPDYIAACGRIREFYDESRTAEIRSRWKASEPRSKWVRGSIVLDSNGDIGRIEARDAHGQVHLRQLHVPTLRHEAHVTTLYELVSLRALARSEQMSRYKLSRLLRASGTKPVCERGKTLYFDRSSAQRAVQMQLQSERNAITLRTLAVRTGVSEAVLGQKVRAGVIRTLGNQAAHRIHPTEAERIEAVVRALHSRSENLRTLEICNSHRRGRAASEVVSWNIEQLLKVTQSLSPDRREILFGQVRWMCEGAGKKRFQYALDAYLLVLQRADECYRRHKAQLLLTLIEVLPTECSRYWIRLLLMASGAMKTYCCLEQRVRQLAAKSGCDDKRAFEYFREHIHQGLTELLRSEHAYLFAGPADPSWRNSPDWDECTPGAIVVRSSDRNPDLGVIVRIEQQCWDAVLRAWKKTLVVRFPPDERRMCVQTRQQVGRSPGSSHEALQVLLGASEVKNLAKLIQQQLRRADGARHHWADKKAS